MIINGDELVLSAQEWECYRGTPQEVVDHINKAFFNILKSYKEPEQAQKQIYSVLDSYAQYGFADSEGYLVATTVINTFYRSNIGKWRVGLHHPNVSDQSTNDSLIVTPQTPRKQLQLSDEALEAMAKAMAPDIVKAIVDSDSYANFICEHVSAKVAESLGLSPDKAEEGIVVELTSNIVFRIGQSLEEYFKPC
jgi:hypothetical protein